MIERRRLERRSAATSQSLITDNHLYSMAKILVLGNINIETTLAINAFPIDYAPVHYAAGGVGQSVSAVGYNLARALRVLGNEVVLLSLIGRDVAAEQIRHTLRRDAIDDRFVLDLAEATPQSVVLHDPHGRRQVHTDLKNVLDLEYPRQSFEQALDGCTALVVTNIGYARSILPLARAAGNASGAPVVTDVHAIAALNDHYNAAFMRAADILFMSHERLPMEPNAWLSQLFARFETQIGVIGMGNAGAALGVREPRAFETVAAPPVERVVSTSGAGDALCAAFVHVLLRTGDPQLAARKAVHFAAHSVQFASSSQGFLDEAGLERAFERRAASQRQDCAMD